MKQIILLVCSVLIALPMFGQSIERNPKDINWIHGGGAPYFWGNKENYPQKFSSLYNSNYLAYPQMIRVGSTDSKGIDYFRKEVDAQAIYSPNNFAIAHSLGGLVARRIDVDNVQNGSPQTKFKGIVTVGSPLNGAVAASSLVNGNFDNFVYNFVFKLTDPLASPLGAVAGGALAGAVVAYTSFIKEVKSNSSIGGAASRALGGNVQGGGTGNVLVNGGLTGGVVQGLAIGGATGALTTALTIPVLLSGAGTTIVYELVKDPLKATMMEQFSGQTLSDLIPGNDKQFLGRTCRTSYKWVPRSRGGRGGYYIQVTTCQDNYTNNYASYTTPTPKVHFVGQEDQPIFMKITESTGDQGKQAVQALNTVKDVAYGLRWFFFIDPIFGVKCQSLGDYLGDGVNVDYAGLIGAVHTERHHRLEQIPTRLLNCFTQRQRSWSRHCGWFSWLCGWIEDIVNIVVCAFKTIFIETLVGYDVKVIDPSDGVVAATSQAGEGSQWKSSLKPVEMSGVNHNEMNGHPNMTKALQNLFKGDYGQTFDIKRK